MRVLFVHPGPLLYTKVFLRLEPLGLELVAEAARHDGHGVRLIDLQVEDHAAYRQLVTEWRPDLIAFSCNYLANVPEIVDLAKATKAVLPRVFICVGGHSASFIARAIIDHGEGAIDCVLRGEGETAIIKLLQSLDGNRNAVAKVRCGDRRRRGAGAGLRSRFQCAPTGARPPAPPQQIFHRNSRPGRLD